MYSASVSSVGLRSVLT